MNAGNLPPGVEPGDSDPPKQRYLAGRLVAEVKMQVACEIWRASRCESENEARQIMQHRLTDIFGTEDGLDCDEIEIRPIKFEPDEETNGA